MNLCDCFVHILFVESRNNRRWRYIMVFFSSTKWQLHVGILLYTRAWVLDRFFYASKDLFQKTNQNVENSKYCIFVYDMTLVDPEWGYGGCFPPPSILILIIREGVVVVVYNSYFWWEKLCHSWININIFGRRHL